MTVGFEQSEIIAKLQKFIDEMVIPFSLELSVKEGDLQSFAILGKYLLLADRVRASIFLVQAGFGHESHVLVRTILELYAEICLLAKDSSYVDRLALERDEASLRQLQLAASGNPYASSIREFENFSDNLSAKGKAVKAAKSRGIKRLEAKEKFKFADMSPEYDALYPRLSDDLHGGLYSLISRYVKFNEDGSDYWISAFPKELPQDFGASMQTCCDALTRASVEVHRHFSTTRLGEFEARVEVLQH